MHSFKYSADIRETGLDFECAPSFLLEAVKADEYQWGECLILCKPTDCLNSSRQPVTWFLIVSMACDELDVSRL